METQTEIANPVAGDTIMIEHQPATILAYLHCQDAGNGHRQWGRALASWDGEHVVWGQFWYDPARGWCAGSGSYYRGETGLVEATLQWKEDNTMCDVTWS